jgi:DNA-binding MarR family transcriptional regulator
MNKVAAKAGSGKRSGKRAGSRKADRAEPATRMAPDSVSTVIAQWRRQRPELTLGPLGLFLGLAHAYSLTAPRIERLMAEYRITRGMFDVLTTLRRAGNPYALNPKQLVQSLLLSGAGLTGRLDQLEAHKLILRLQDPNDGRASKIRLTPRGLRLVDRIVPRLIALETGFAAGMSVIEVSQLTRLLDLLASSVQTSGQADLR